MANEKIPAIQGTQNKSYTIYIERIAQNSPSLFAHWNQRKKFMVV